MKNFWENIGDDVNVRSYLPDPESQSKPIDRTFAYNILSTLKPGFLTQVINNSITKRAKKFKT